MTRRITDQAGHRWPVTGTACPVCKMPADVSLAGEPHPDCGPARTLDQTELKPVLQLLQAELGATTHRPLDVWRRYGGRVQPDQPAIPAPRTSTSIPASAEKSLRAGSSAGGTEHHLQGES